MDKYSDYLAVNVLNEERTVSYRLLSRALKVHSNVAKQMLFDFHKKQTTRKPGCVHATYLISGRQKQRHSTHMNGIDSQDADGDHPMPSSPFPGSSAPQIEHEEELPTWIRLITLAKEEDLEAAKDQLDEVDSIHIYSLQAGSINDLQTLTDCNRRVAAEHREDPLQAWKHYGTIQNPNVKRRTGRKAPPPVAAPPPIPAKAQPKKDLPTPAPDKATKTTDPPKLVKETSSASASEPSSQKSTSNKTAPLKRESSSLFKSFAKSKPPKAKPAEEETSPAPAFSDDEAEPEPEDDDSMAVDTELKEQSGKTKRDREAELKEMMDAEDEVMDDIPDPTADGEGESQEVATPGEEPKEEPKEEEKEQVTVTNGRRRGRRRVMKKKTTKDEDGYIVTKEEAAWESFSEDEPAPPAKKAKPTAAVFSAVAKGGAKKGGKPGQGNIMSFFGKK